MSVYGCSYVCVTHYVCMYVCMGGQRITLAVFSKIWYLLPVRQGLSLLGAQQVC